MSAASALARRSSTLGTLLGLAAALVGLGIGAQRIGDNSFLTHLATGRRMLDEGVVREDAFTWTSSGESVVVQSWMASLLYGAIDEIAGFGGLRILMAVTAAALGWLVWQLGERSVSVTTRVAVLVPVFWIGLRTWTERPLLLAFVLFAVAMLVAERGSDPRWLVVVGILWVNIHGSWPLGIVLLGARWVGAFADRDRDAAETDRAAGLWLTGGILAGGIVNPYGPALLWFPVALLGKQDTLRHISEWQASSFESTWTRLFLVLVAAAVFAARKAPLRLVVPAVVFVIAALTSARNIPLATLALVPLLAAGLPPLPGPNGERRSDAIRFSIGVLAVLLLVLPTFAVRAPHTDLDRYPIEAVDALEELGLSPAGHRVVHQDFVGNYLDLRYGPVGATWIDDRFELHDADLVDDYLSLLHGESDWRSALERHEPDAVLWARDRVLVELLASDGWNLVWSDEEWAILVPT